MKVEYGPEFEKSLKKLIWFERTRHINPKEWYRQVKWFLQRGRRGYSDADVWNAFTHIAATTKAFVAQQKKHGMGYPGNLTEKDWDNVLTEIDWLMDEVLETNDTPVEVYLSEAYQKRRKKAEALFGRYWQHFWD